MSKCEYKRFDRNDYYTCTNDACEGTSLCSTHTGPQKAQPVNVGIDWQNIAEKAKEDVLRLMDDNTKLIEEREAFCVENKELKGKLTTIAGKVMGDLDTLSVKVKSLSDDEYLNELEAKLEEVLEANEVNYAEVIRLRKVVQQFQKAENKASRLIRKLNKLYD